MFDNEGEHSHHITTNCEAMAAPLPVRPLIARRKLSIAEEFVCDLLGGWWKMRIDFATVDQEGCLRLCVIFLHHSAVSALPRTWHVHATDL